MDIKTTEMGTVGLKNWLFPRMSLERRLTKLESVTVLSLNTKKPRLKDQSLGKATIALTLIVNWV